SLSQQIDRGLELLAHPCRVGALGHCTNDSRANPAAHESICSYRKRSTTTFWRLLMTIATIAPGKRRRRGRTTHRFSVKSRNQLPARSVHIPAAPAAVMAEAEESFTITFATPFAEPTSFTGFEPVTDKPMVAHHPRSAIPLGACPSTVTVAPLWRLTCSVPFASSATS